MIFLLDSLFQSNVFYQIVECWGPFSYTVSQHALHGRFSVDHIICMVDHCVTQCLTADWTFHRIVGERFGDIFVVVVVVAVCTMYFVAFTVVADTLSGFMNCL